MIAPMICKLKKIGEKDLSPAEEVIVYEFDHKERTALIQRADHSIEIRQLDKIVLESEMRVRSPLAVPPGQGVVLH